MNAVSSATLEQAVSHHVNEEEREMLPKTRDALDAQRREELGSAFDAAKAKAHERGEAAVRDRMGVAHRPQPRTAGRPAGLVATVTCP
jgi:hypothetical protein